MIYKHTVTCFSQCQPRDVMPYSVWSEQSVDEDADDSGDECSVL